MAVATCFQPDGSQITIDGDDKIDGCSRFATDGKHPYEITRPREERAFLTAQKTWWPTKKPESQRMELRRAPLGAVIKIDGEDYARWEEIPTIDPETDEITALTEGWVQIRADVRAAAMAERLKAANERRRADKAARGRNKAKGATATPSSKPDAP